METMNVVKDSVRTLARCFQYAGRYQHWRRRVQDCVEVGIKYDDLLPPWLPYVNGESVNLFDSDVAIQ
jgi:hypothetical protein